MPFEPPRAGITTNVRSALEPGATQPLSISQTIRDFTTRTHNAGFHKVELMLNGDTVAEGGFDLAI